MATSGSFNFATSRDNLITDAHLYIGAIGEGESVAANGITEGARMLNMLMKAWAADGMPLWAMRRGTILPMTSVSSINTDGHVVTTYVATSASANAASGAATITVADGTGIVASGQIGIELDSNSVQWTRVTSITGSVITLVSTLTGAVTSTNRVYSYLATTDRVEKPIRVIDANTYDYTSSTSANITLITREDYYKLGNRNNTSGVPNQLFYDVLPTSRIAIETNGTMYFYPRFDSGNNVIEFTYQRPLADFDATGDEPDCPQAFYLALTIGLASLLGPKYGVPIEERAALMKEALFYRDQALQSIYPEGSIFIQPELF